MRKNEDSEAREQAYQPGTIAAPCCHEFLHILEVISEMDTVQPGAAANPQVLLLALTWAPGSAQLRKPVQLP